MSEAKSEKSLVPKLRFKEFADHWQACAFETLYGFGSTYSVARDQLNELTGPARVVHYGDVHTKFPSHVDFTVVQAPFLRGDLAWNFDIADSCKVGDIIFADASEDLTDVGKAIEVVALPDHTVLPGMHTIRAFRKDDDPVIGFGGYLFQSEFVKLQIRHQAQGTKVFGIAKSRLGQIILPLPPSRDEQRKIVGCLQSLDELIALGTQKLDALKRHKKGLLQQLFPAEGEAVPRLRFLHSKAANEWELLALRDVARISSGTTPSRSKPEYFSGGTIPWVKTMDLNNSRITHTQELVTEAACLRVNPPGSVLVAMYGGFNQIGRTGILTMAAATNQAVAVLQPKAGVLDSEYLLLWLNANVEHWKIVAASSRKDANITSSDVASFPVALPTIEEQRRLSRAVYDLDIALFQMKNNLTSLYKHKAALMQQLFPAMDRAEG